ncbi:MAG: twin-arginine translocase TatA/TatE family subunit [Bacteroidetes bacterium]|jgi:sec-independent protein translocase protein TatA|nr:twin-arginine translocase TatA/TatE family subunit [Bacteroidota bacterium]MBT6685283.1 twin-arginine translocase TatA/TatE family subunit [Bacteroidota bacterium]MBT7141730.1 twin-arginine translocase TatA/TatE family subunit [Bacteroidota bacterium]MBT7491428.1 twin-arginine translocase TatA/TatE family subunit [Bacteroidota bacterium]
MNFVVFISGGEIFVILIVILLLFGSKKLPEIAKGFGKGMKEFRKATNDIKREFENESKVVDDIKEISKTIKKNSNL